MMAKMMHAYKLYNFRTGELETIWKPPEDWRDYIPQTPPAQGLYTLLIEAYGMSPLEAATEVLQTILGENAPGGERQEGKNTNK